MKKKVDEFERAKSDLRKEVEHLKNDKIERDQEHNSKAYIVSKLYCLHKCVADDGQGVGAGGNEEGAGAGAPRVRGALINYLIKLINYPRYEELLGTKLGLDTEIAVYRALLDSEERRVAR